MRVLRALSAVAAIVTVSGGSAFGTVLFSDSFDRADDRDIDASLTGVVDNTGSSLGADGVYSQPWVDPLNESGGQDGDASNGGGTQIIGGQLELAVGAGTSSAYINHNFINNEILTAGGFTVSLDITGYSGTARQHGGAFAIGMSQAEVAMGGDAFSGANLLTSAYTPDPYGITGQPVATNVLSDFWIGIRGNQSLAWGSSTGNVLGIGQNGLPAKTGSLSVDFHLSDFSAGSTVNYEVFYDGASQGTGSFTWSGNGENYIALDSRDGNGVFFDNLSIATIPEPATALLVLAGAVVLRQFRRRR